MEIKKFENSLSNKEIALNRIMNREIEFRGWFQGINGSEFWVYGFLSKQDNGNWEINSNGVWYTIDDPGEYTGLRDKNNKKIFEGDIVKIHMYNDYYEIGQIVFDENKGLFGFLSPDGAIYGLTSNDSRNEVIGNVFENQELLIQE